MIAVVIVSFDMRERLRRHLELLCAQSERPDCVVVVNTGKDGVEWAKDEFGKSFRIELLHTNNIGPAGAFREGAKRAYALGADYVIYADDDAHPALDVVSRLRKQAEAGANAVIGSYADGDPIVISNHYLMVSRKMLARAGFHFAPLFIMMEDSEYYERIARAGGIIHDPAVVITHPYRPVQSFGRWHLTARNIMIVSALWGYIPFLRYSASFPLRVAFLSSFTGRPEYAFSYIRAMADYSMGRFGRPEPLGYREFAHEEAPAPMGRDVAAVVRTEEERGVYGDAGFDADKLLGTVSGSPLGMLRCAIAWAGKRVYLCKRFFTADTCAYLPCAVFAKELHTEDMGKTVRIFRGGPLKAAAFLLLFLAMIAFTAPLSLPLYFLRGRTYRGMFRRQMEEDGAFCAKADGI